MSVPGLAGRVGSTSEQLPQMWDQSRPTDQRATHVEGFGSERVPKDQALAAGGMMRPGAALLTSARTCAVSLPAGVRGVVIQSADFYRNFYRTGRNGVEAISTLQDCSSQKPR